MSNSQGRISFALKAIALAVLTAILTVAGLGASSLANAGSGHQGSGPTVEVSTTPPAMRLTTSTDAKIDKGGTQGNFKSPTQGTADSADQDAFAVGSFEAVPQDRQH